jgi:hypothetical protein
VSDGRSTVRVREQGTSRTSSCVDGEALENLQRYRRIPCRGPETTRDFGSCSPCSKSRGLFNPAVTATKDRRTLPLFESYVVRWDLCVEEIGLAASRNDDISQHSCAGDSTSVHDGIGQRKILQSRHQAPAATLYRPLTADGQPPTLYRSPPQIAPDRPPLSRLPCCCAS